MLQGSVHQFHYYRSVFVLVNGAKPVCHTDVFVFDVNFQMFFECGHHYMFTIFLSCFWRKSRTTNNQCVIALILINIVNMSFKSLYLFFLGLLLHFLGQIFPCLFRAFLLLSILVLILVVL